MGRRLPAGRRHRHHAGGEQPGAGRSQPAAGFLQPRRHGLLAEPAGGGCRQRLAAGALSHPALGIGRHAGGHPGRSVRLPALQQPCAGRAHRLAVRRRQPGHRQVHRRARAHAGTLAGIEPGTAAGRQPAKPARTPSPLEETNTMHPLHHLARLSSTLVLAVLGSATQAASGLPAIGFGDIAVSLQAVATGLAAPETMRSAHRATRAACSWSSRTACCG